jgi:hypothetical protein
MFAAIAAIVSLEMEGYTSEGTSGSVGIFGLRKVRYKLLRFLSVDKNVDDYFLPISFNWSMSSL